MRLTIAVGFLIAATISPPMVMGEIGGASGAHFQVVDQFGGLKRPTRIAIAADGRIFVSDPVRGVVAILDSVGRRVGTLTGRSEPLGIAQSRARRRVPCSWTCAPCPVVFIDTAYVGDQRDGSVWVYENGQPTRSLGSGPGEFLKPNGIAVTSKQIVYVADSGASQIKVFRANGTLRNTFGSWGWGNGQLDFPTDIALDELTGELFVSDFNNERIAVFGLDGAWHRDLYAPLNDQGDPAFYRIAGLGVGPSGRLYVVDNALSSVTVLNADGTLVDILGYESGSYWTGQLKVPIDAASDGHRLYVTSSQERLIKVFEVTQ